MHNHLTPIRQRISKKIDITCEVCGEVFRAYRYDAERRNRRFCSLTCAGGNSAVTRPEQEELTALYESGLSTNGLANHYGVSKGTIYNWLKHFGISTRSNGEGVTLAQTGKEHSSEHNEAISRAHIARGSWLGRDHPNIRYPERSRPRSRGGKRESLGGLYVRSSWEANYALYLNLLIERGEILKWEYEPDTFEFPVKRGNRFYTPDFKVTEKDGRIVYHEVKGWMDGPSKTRLKRMAKHYPHVKVIVIGEEEYKAIKKWAGLIPGWE